MNFADKVIREYLSDKDWRVNENSNASFSYPSLLNHLSSTCIAHYTLQSVYNKEIADAHQNGDIHIHDLGAGIIGYCSGYSLRDLLSMGFTGHGGRASAAPAKHFDTALGQICNFLCTLQTEWSGAQAFSSFDTLLAPFVRYDNLDYKAVKQNIQQWVFMMNIASRWGQCPFTNITLDWVPPKDLKDQNVIVGGEIKEEKYNDFQVEMDMINKAFLEIMLKGDRDGRVFTFPIPTYNITEDFTWDNENAKLLFELTSKYGLPTFQNFIGSDLDPSDTRSLCCRLRLDKRKLERKVGGLFGAGELVGSIGVCTINMVRLGYTCNTEEEFFSKLKELMIISKDSLEIKRQECIKNLEMGLMPYTKVYLNSFKNHFSTLGLIGMNEACLNLFNENIGSDKGQEFSIRVLEYMRDLCSEFQEETGNLYNLEATPAEGVCYRLAKIDKEKYPEIITAGHGEDIYYTNSTNLPVNYTDDIFEALDLQEKLQSIYTGGTIFHAFIGERIESAEQTGQLIKKICELYKIPYITISPTFSICPVHGYIAGEHHSCPL